MNRETLSETGISFLE